MKQVDCFHLSLLLVERLIVGVLWWPILELENLSGGEKANDPLPMLLGELMS
jgi:hypothetical protein